MPGRIVLHVDMDAFFAAVEQRDFPELRGKPVIVGGPMKRGVVTTCSYEARPFGVHSAMPMARAQKLCPQAIVVPGRMSVYAEISEQVMAILDDFSPAVEPLSIDEAFVDMTGSERIFGPPDRMARAIKAAVLDATQLTCSVGIARNKFLAKLASDLDKPDGITWVPFGRERAFIAPLPVRRLWGVGPVAGARLAALKLQTIGEVAAADPAWLDHELGALGRHIHMLANARDDRVVVPHPPRRSIGSERTLMDDVIGRDQVEQHVRRSCRRVARELRRKGLRARSVRVKVRYSETFQLATRDGPLDLCCDDSATLFAGARKLLDRLDLERPMRLVGAAAFDLVPSGQAEQGDLFLDDEAIRRTRLERTLDRIRERFGESIDDPPERD